MKRPIYVLAMLLMATTVMFTACNEDDDDNPDPIDLSPVANFLGGAGYVDGDATLTTGEMFKVGITAVENSTSGKKLESFVITRTFNNVPVTVLDTTFSLETFTWDIELYANAEAGQERWAFTVTDKDGEETELAFIITTEAAGAAVMYYESIDMGSFDDSNFGSFLVTATGQAKKKAEAATVSAMVDVAFFNGATNGMTFGAPANTTVIDVYDLDWATLNATEFMATSPVDADGFDAIGDTYQFPEFTNETDIVNQLSIGDVIYFKTVTGMHGFLKINSSTKDGFEINVDLKMEYIDGK